MGGSDATDQTVDGAPTRSLHVLATSTEGTKSALLTAKDLIGGSGDARVVLLIPRVQSFTAPFDPASDERTTMIDAHRALAAEVGLHVSVLFCVCRHSEDVVYEMLGRSSLVIVGGRRSVWWPTREERLVARLTGAGYAVVFAQVGAECRPAVVPAVSS